MVKTRMPTGDNKITGLYEQMEAVKGYCFCVYFHWFVCMCVCVDEYADL